MSGTLDVTVQCGSQAFVANFEFDLGYSNCSSEGVTVNSTSGPLKVSGKFDSEGDAAEMKMKASGLQLKGDYCSNSFDETCSIDLNISGKGSDYNFAGHVCGCDVSKLAESQNACSAAASCG